MDAICSLILSPFTPAPGLTVTTTREWGGEQVPIDPPEYRWGSTKMRPDLLPRPVIDRLPWISRARGVCLSIPHEWLSGFQAKIHERPGDGEVAELATSLAVQCRQEQAWVLAFLAHAEDFEGVFMEPIEHAIDRLAQSLSLDHEMVGFVSYFRA
ncbi:hypothetical protein [Nannocystis pusilla]|uniref:hypothetical protein n=1 Tax=Nannocystis pusilla TaxID=889268 RepID=UPI003DA587A9